MISISRTRRQCLSGNYRRDRVSKKAIKARHFAHMIDILFHPISWDEGYYWDLGFGVSAFWGKHPTLLPDENIMSL